MEKPLHLVAEPRSLAPAPTAIAADTQLAHELGQRGPQDQLPVLGSHRFSAHPGQQQARQVPKGQLVLTCRGHDQRVRTVDALVLGPVAGVGAGQAAQRHHPRHEAQIGVRFAGSDKLVHLIEAGEVVQRLGRGSAQSFPRAGQIDQGFGNGNQLAALTLHGLFSHAPQTKPPGDNRLDCDFQDGLQF